MGRRLTLVILLAVAASAAPADAATPRVLAKSPRAILTSDIGRGWAGWAATNARGCVWIYRARLTTRRAERLTRCRRGAEALRVFVVGRGRVVWWESHRRRTGTATVVLTAAGGRAVVLDRAFMPNRCAPGGSIHAPAADERFFVYARTLYGSCDIGRAPISGGLRRIDALATRVRSRAVRGADATYATSVSGRRVASLPLGAASGPHHFEVREIATGALVRRFTSDAFEEPYGILTSGGYVGVLVDAFRSVDFVLYDVRDGRVVGSIELGYEDAETLGAHAALVGDRLVYAEGPKIYVLDADTKTKRLLYDRKRWPAPVSISVARGIVAWESGNRILGFRLADG